MNAPVVKILLFWGTLSKECNDAEVYTELAEVRKCITT